MIEACTQTIWQAFAATAGRYPERPLFNVLDETAGIYGIQSGETSYREVSDQVTELAAALQQSGYGAGFRVMLLLENRPEFFVWLLALNRIGASAVPVNPDLRHSELTYMARHSEPSLMVAIEPRCQGLAAAAKEAGLAVPVITPGDPVPHPGTAGPVALQVETRGGAIEGETLEAALLYTSGTTGNPKGCILTNSYFLEAGRWYAQAGGLCALSEDGERMITPLPIFHMNAMAYSFMAMVAVGGCLTVLDRFHPSSWWESVRESGATCLHYLGVMPSMLMGAPESAADRDHSVRFGFGAGVDPKLHASFEERFGFPLVEAWAMTETGAGAVICANQLPRRVGESCLGKPGDELDVMIVDAEGAESRNGPGELLVRRKGEEPQRGFFSGYFKNREATAEAWADGWFHTGDIVRREDDGSMFFVDRKKNVIRRSGENIAAVEVESALMRHPAVKAAAVAAVPDPVRGDEVFACLKVEGDAGPALAGEIVGWCLEQLAYYKAPGYVAFVEALPLTSTQKIQRRELKQLAERLVEDPATVDTRAMKKRTAA
ncbi:acyl-CoA synthetase (AMP-forming)/AMP-acid ligase II [Hoeflea halophila]|uniref:Acyl-CoA synthetase (AMP-forming)/AMP-acid ligase II n=1 Tax=Hoeflea halophila TaxID=714899 RepID=A0A286HMB0_9HYPH|nr:AMP-binding protein [Hoeflea halophila]SOE08911.1 acyl-CoA synthetase (AMP-forming)/AMP-acid ligase II [Hoeflea halophila]